MNRETAFLKCALVLMGLPVLALCIFVLPEITEYFAELNPSLSFLQYPFLLGLYVTAIFYFIALYQTFKLLSYIDKNQAFSELSVEALKRIKHCAVVIGSLYVVFMPLIYLIAEKDDAPGVILVGLVVPFASIVIAVFAAVLQRLLQEAIDIKSENDLTV